MRYTQNETMYGVYHCPCGKSKSYEYKEISTEGNPYGDVFFSSIPYNLGDQYCYCPSCKQYWYDGNAKEWNELSGIKKFFYAIGFWFLPQIIPSWLIYRYIKQEGPQNLFLRFLSYVVATILLIPLSIIYDLFLFSLMLVLNLPFFPFVLIYHLSEIRASKHRIKYGSPNKRGYYEEQIEEIDFRPNKIFPWM